MNTYNNITCIIKKIMISNKKLNIFFILGIDIYLNIIFLVQKHI